MNSEATAEPVAIVDLADELGTRKQTLFKIARRLGLDTTRRREFGRGNQLITVVSAAGAQALRAEYANARQRGEPSIAGMPLIPDEGSFYVIQLEPQLDPGRFKLGFTADLDGRLRHHRCSAPFAIYRRTWPCRRSWERTAIDCLAAGLERIHTEVFRTDALGQLVARGDQFFGLMPELGGAVGQDDKVASLKRLILTELA